MPRVAFGPYEPDKSDLDRAHAAVLSNVLPRGDGWGPAEGLEALTQALPAACRGIFYARRTTGAIAVFAATATRLYLLDNSTFAWDDVSKSGSPYTSIESDRQWQFAQFGDVVIAIQRNIDPQAFTLSSDTEFDDLAGTPPAAGAIAVVGRFLVLSDLTDNPFRIHWCGLNDITNWTAGTGLSDYNDFPDGGPVGRVAGGEFGFIFQDLAIRRMVWVPGSDVVFEITRVADDRGLLARYSVTSSGETVYFLSTQGFCAIDANGLRQIGKERVDRTLVDTEIDDAAYHLVMGAADPDVSRVFWTYRTDDVSEDTFTRLICYDYALDRWSAPISITGEFMTALAQPGLTLEALDKIAPGYTAVSGAADNGSGLVRLTVGSTSGFTTGDSKTIAEVTGTTEANGTWTITVVDATHIDLQGSTFANAYVSGGYVAGDLDQLGFSLDEVSIANLPQITVVDDTHKIALLTGDNLEATLQSAEQSLDGWRIEVNGFTPITDATSVYGASVMRDTLNVTPTTGDESEMNEDGFIPLLDEARYVRGQVRIPAATEWTFVTGIDPAVQRGSRL